MTAVSLALTIDIDLDDWIAEYHIEGGREVARDDVRAAIALVAQDWLRESVGFKAATVRVGTAYPARRS